MDAASLFGGPAFSAPPLTGNRDDPPHSAASLFGAERDDEQALRASLQSEAPEVQDMPDDLFGGGGDERAGGFGASAAPPRPPDATADAGTGGLGGGRRGGGGPSPSVDEMPDGLFGESGGNEGGPSAFGFGGGGRSGYCDRGGDRVGGTSAGPPVGGLGGNGRAASSRSSVGNALFGAPPPQAASGFGGAVSSNAFLPPRPATEAFDAPASDLFGGPPPDASSGLGETGDFGSRSSGSPWPGTDTRSQPGVSVPPAIENRWHHDASAAGGEATVPLSSGRRSASPPPPRSYSSPPADVFGAPPRSFGAPPTTDVSAGPPPRSTPSTPVDTSTPLKQPGPPLARGADSPGPPSQPPVPPAPSAQLFGSPATGGYGAQSPSQSSPETRGRFNSSPFGCLQQSDPGRFNSSPCGSQHGDPTPAVSQEAVRTWDDGKRDHVRSWESSSSAGRPRAYSTNSGAGQSPSGAELEARPSTMFGAPPKHDFGGAPPAPPTSSSSKASPTAAFGSSGDSVGGWRGSTFRSDGVGEGTTSAADLFGSLATAGTGGFGGADGEQGEQSLRPPSAWPSGNTGACMGTNGGSSVGGFGATDKRSGAWSEEHRDSSTFGGPLGSPPEEAFGGEAGGDDDDQSWWQSSTGNEDHPDAQVQSSTSGGDKPAMTADPVDSTVLTESTDAREEVGATEAGDLPHGVQAGFAAVTPYFLGAPPSALFRPPEMATGGEEAAENPQAVPKEPAEAGSPPTSTAFASQRPSGIPIDLANGGETASTSGVEAGAEGSGVVPGSAARLASSQAGGGQEEGAVSPGWEKQPSRPLELGVFGAPPGDLFGAAAAEDPFAAGAAAGYLTMVDEEYDDWEECSAEEEVPSARTEALVPPLPVPATLNSLPNVVIPLTTGSTSRSSFRANDVSPAAALMAGAASSARPVLFASRSSSWTDRGGLLEADVPEGGVGTVLPQPPPVPAKHDPPPKVVIPPARGLIAQSSFMANVTPAEAARVLGAKPSSPPRLFASRSSSWAAREDSIEEKEDFANMFTNSCEKWGEGETTLPGTSPPERALMSATSAATAVPPKSLGVEATSGATKDGGKAGPGSALSTPFGAWSHGSGANSEGNEGFLPLEGDVGSRPLSGNYSPEGGRPPAVELSSFPPSSEGDTVSSPPSDTAQEHKSAVVVPPSMGDGVEGKIPKSENAEHKQAENPLRAPPAVSSLGLAVKKSERKVDVDTAALGNGTTWREGDWRVDEGGSASNLEGGAEKKGDIQPEVGGGGGNVDEVVCEGRSRPGSFNFFSDAGSNVGGDYWGEGEGGVDGVEDIKTSVIEKDGEECGASGSTDDDDNEASIAETTASEFFAVRALLFCSCHWSRCVLGCVQW